MTGKYKIKKWEFELLKLLYQGWNSKRRKRKINYVKADECSWVLAFQACQPIRKLLPIQFFSSVSALIKERRSINEILEIKEKGVVFEGDIKCQTPYYTKRKYHCSTLKLMYFLHLVTKILFIYFLDSRPLNSYFTYQLNHFSRF